MEMNEGLRERKTRRLAAKVGVRVIKSRARTWSHSNQLGYMLADAGSGFLPDGEHLDLSLNYIEDWINSYAAELSSAKGRKG